MVGRLPESFLSDQFLQNMVDALSTIASDIPPPPPPFNDPDHIIQPDHVDEAPQKVCVTNFTSSFLVDVKSEIFYYQGRKRVVPSSKPTTLAKPSKKQ